MSSALKERIIEELDSMTDGQLAQVFESVKTVRSRPKRGATVGELVAEFGGTIPDHVLDEMDRVIEEDCERIDPD